MESILFVTILLLLGVAQVLSAYISQKVNTGGEVDISLKPGKNAAAEDVPEINLEIRKIAAKLDSLSELVKTEFKNLQNEVRNIKSSLMNADLSYDWNMTNNMWTTIYELETSADINGTVMTNWLQAMKKTRMQWRFYNLINVSIIAEPNVRHWVTFQVSSTESSMTWFSPENIIDSSFLDISTHHLWSSFSIFGYIHRGVKRRFYAVSSHGGCDHDYGWFVVLDKGGAQYCEWESFKIKYPVLLVCPGSTNCNFKDAVTASRLVVQAMKS